MWPIFKKMGFGKTKTPGRRLYASAMTNRLVGDWIAGATTADAEIFPSLQKTRARTRQLVRDNDYAGNIVRNFQNNTVGLGIGMQSQVLMERGSKLNPKINAKIEYSWEKWKEKQNCDTSGLSFFPDMERILMAAIPQDGEIYVRTVTQAMGNSKVPLALELIEGDLLDENYNDNLKNGNTIRMGVERNAWKRPVAFHFFSQHPGDTTYLTVHGSRRIRVPANEIISLFPRNRASQSRGFPILAAAVMKMHHMAGYEESEVVSARATAALMGFIETEGDLPADGTENGEQITEFSPGVFKTLRPGEKVTVPQLNRPSNQFDPFMRVMLRGIGAGVGQSYESVSKDYSQGSYSSARQALIEDRLNYRVIQEWLLRNFHNAVYSKWLDLAVLSGELDLKGYETNPEFYNKPKWLKPGYQWIDPLKEAEAYKTAIRGGFRSLTDVVSEQGGDIEELFKQLAYERELAKQYGLTLDTDPAFDPKLIAANNQGGASDSADDDTPPTPAE